MVGAALQPFYFPHLKAFELGLQVACRLVAAAAALQLLRCRSGRIWLGPTLFGAGLLTLHLNWPPFTSRIPSARLPAGGILFGSSMLLVVLDDVRLRMRRLAVLNELTVLFPAARIMPP